MPNANATVGNSHSKLPIFLRLISFGYCALKDLNDQKYNTMLNYLFYLLIFELSYSWLKSPLLLQYI